MGKKIVPNLMGLRTGPNKDIGAMLKALEGGPVTSVDPSKVTTADLKIGVVYELPLAILARSDNNARVFYAPGEVDATAASLAKNGQMVPALGYVKEDRVVIYDGQKRFNACVEGKLSLLKVLIQPPPQSGAEEYELSRTANLARSAQTAFDDAVRWEQMLAKGEYGTNEELAQRLGVAPSTVSKTLGLLRIPATIRRQMMDEPRTSTLGVAYEISNIFAANLDVEEMEKVAEEVIITVVKSELSRERTIDLIKSKVSGPKQRSRGESAPFRFGRHKGAIKVNPARGELSLSIRGLSEDEVEDLRRRVEKACQIEDEASGA